MKNFLLAWLKGIADLSKGRVDRVLYRVAGMVVLAALLVFFYRSLVHQPLFDESIAVVAGIAFAQIGVLSVGVWLRRRWPERFR